MSWELSSFAVLFCALAAGFHWYERAHPSSKVLALVATHDAEFAAAFAQRVVLLADGRPIADGPIADVLTGGWYFATETARIVGALTPEEGAERIRRRLTLEVTP